MVSAGEEEIRYERTFSIQQKGSVEAYPKAAFNLTVAVHEIFPYVFSMSTRAVCSYVPRNCDGTKKPQLRHGIISCLV